MPLRWQEVALPLVLITVLLVFKHLPATEHLPLARAAGVVAFAYAALLALRLVQPEEAWRVDGWSELRASPVEHVFAYGAAGLSAVLLSMVILAGARVVHPAEMIAAFVAAATLAGAAFFVAFTSLFTRVRWNARALEHRSAWGRSTRIAWSDVRSCEPDWRGVVISTHDARRVHFSQFNAGAAELSRHATTRARRNLESATRAFAV